jgi:hypothetical protein
MTEQEGQHPPSGGIFMLGEKATFIRPIGELELWYDDDCNDNGHHYVITGPEHRCRVGTFFNYTRFKLEENGNLHFLDADVVPNVPELCMLYAYFAEKENT